MAVKPVDALGYLSELATKVDQPWFTLICDKSAELTKPTLTIGLANNLVPLIRKRASYIGPRTSVTSSAVVAASVASDHLERLHDFADFKLLSNALDVSFSKRITLVFGTNGSGKSSMCDCLKLLATPDAPKRPLQNVRASSTTLPKFSYKFKSDSTSQTWSATAGFGSRQHAVKYFDSIIAGRNVREAVQPERVIELSPFRLNVFENCKLLCTQLRDRIQQDQASVQSQLNTTITSIQAAFSDFTDSPLATLSTTSLSVLDAQKNIGLAFPGDDVYHIAATAHKELQKGLTPQGLSTLRLEIKELEEVSTDIATLVSAVEPLWKLNPEAIKNQISLKEGIQIELTKDVIPDAVTLEDFMVLIGAALKPIELSSISEHMCPLCRRTLGPAELKLFKSYRDLLAGELEAELTVLRADFNRAKSFAKQVANVDITSWSLKHTLSESDLKLAVSRVTAIRSASVIDSTATVESEKALGELKAFALVCVTKAEKKKATVALASTDKAVVAAQVESANSNVEQLRYARVVSRSLPLLELCKSLAGEVKELSDLVPSFTPILKRITDSTKTAYEELVVGDFENRLNNEYLALTEKPMSSFGVALARKGSEASVTVSPQVGGKDIEGVLSEGEQRVHALALFFAELETCRQSVIVFDDPISSFDYNYTTNFCNRLRDFALSHSTRQIVILTHSWEFFVNVQSVLNKTNLQHHLSVQVLENCSSVAEYVEKSDDLKLNISTILGRASEPSKSEKEELAGKMRRLIECVVNELVFNKQRHQYKQKSQSVSEFEKYTKLVSLLPTEATTLKDLYSKLSISEHDDARSSYVNTDKATFTSRYNSIIGIEAALMARR